MDPTTLIAILAAAVDLVTKTAGAIDAIKADLSATNQAQIDALYAKAHAATVVAGAGVDQAMDAIINEVPASA